MFYPNWQEGMFGLGHALWYAKQDANVQYNVLMCICYPLIDLVLLIRRIIVDLIWLLTLSLPFIIFAMESA